MQKSSNQNILQIGIIILLVIFNSLQIYGIYKDEAPVAKRIVSTAPQQEDTTRVQIQINILNGCGVNGVGIVMMKYCRSLGYDVVEMGNYQSFDVEHSLVIDRSGKETEVKILAKQIGISQNNVVKQFSSEHLVAASIVIGKDYKELLPWK